MTTSPNGRLSFSKHRSTIPLPNMIQVQRSSYEDFLQMDLLTEERARQVTYALHALDAALAGETNLDHLFPDLAGREPELPEHLRKEVKRG